MEKARGECIALSDQDDRWHPRKLERQVAAMWRRWKRGERGILVHSDLSLINGEGHPIAPSYYKKRGYNFPDRRIPALMLSRGGVMGNTIMIDRTLLEAALPFPPQLRYHDWWLGVVAEFFGQRITLEEPLVAYRIHGRNSSGKSRWLAGELLYPWRHRWLPYREKDRIEAVRLLLQKVATAEHKRILESYLDYLEEERIWIRHYRRMRAEGFFEGSLLYRGRIVIRMLVASILGRGTE